MKKIVLFLNLLFIFSLNTFSQQDFWLNTNFYFGSEVTGLVTSINNELFASTESNGIFHSSNNGLGWIAINNGLSSNTISALSISPETQTLIACSWGGDYFRSTNNGELWIPFSSFNAMNLTSNITGVFFAGTAINGVVRSNDDGLTWVMRNSGLTQFSIYSFAFTDSSTVFASSYLNAVYRSTNNGDLWTPIPIPAAIEAVNSLAAHDGILYAGTDGQGVYATDDAQINWTQKINGLTNLHVRKVLINSDGHIYISTNGGTFCSKDNGAGWTDISSGLTDFNITCMTFSNDGFIFCGTESGKVFRSYNTTTLIEQNDNENPETYRLYQNYPNPFNPSTKVSWQAPLGSWQTLKVYDVLGNEVTTLVNEYRPAGSYEVEFNPASSIKHPASGVYFYRLQAGDYIETKKMILLK
jgi:photosystem II stability/assembly factor-like uncharacterized protein